MTSAGGASRFSRLLGTQVCYALIQSTCLHNSQYLLAKMDDNAPLVWEKADQQTFREAKPRFVGGCWNNYFSSNVIHLLKNYVDFRIR